MKKLFIGLLAIAGLMTSCLQKENALVYFNPDKSVAPTVQGIEGSTLSKDGADIVIPFEGIKFDINAPKTYTLYASASNDFELAKTLTASFGKNAEGKEIVTIKQGNLNSTLLNLGAVPDETFTVFLRISAWMANDKGNPIESSLKLSNVISIAFTPYNQLILDKDEYDHVFVIGNFCAWDWNNVNQYLYDYSKDGDTFTGVIDFGDKVADGFKLTGFADWDDAHNDSNWGSVAQEETPEQELIQLTAGSGSKDIKCLSHRFYNLTFHKKNLTLVPGAGFDSVGMVGTINSWGELPDIEMTYNSDFVRFWADYEFTQEEKVKFRTDSDWAINWGADCVPGGDDIVVAPGKYRVYFNLNKKTIEFDANMYGKDEPTANGGDEEDGTIKEWMIAGTLNENNWSPAESTMKFINTEGNTWIIRKVEIKAGDEFKICANGDWAVNFGGPEANATSTIDSTNPYGVYAATIDQTFNAGGTNIQITEDGTYNITLNYVAEGTSTIKIEKYVAVYSLIGEINGDSWTKDIIMTEKDGIWTSPIVNITGGFKIRYDLLWEPAENVYGFADDQETALDTEITLVQPGSNMTVPAAGDYKISFNPATKVVVITQPAFPEHLYMIGDEFSRWNWASDEIVEMIPVHPNGGEAQFWTIRYFSADKGFKFCAKRDWDGDFHSLTTNDGYTVVGGNCTVAEDGFYMVHIDLKNEKVHIEPARVYGMGNCFGGWDEATEANKFAVEGKTMTATLAADGEIRMYAESSIATPGNWWTREFIFFDGKIAYRGAGDDQERVQGTAGQKLTLDFNAGTATLE